MSGEPLAIAVVCEAEADFRTAGEIADRVLVDSRSSDDELRPSVLRRWLAWQRESYLRWPDVKKLARELRITAHGHFGGEPAAPDAQAGRKAIRVVRMTHGDDSAIMLIRDSDGNKNRRTGLEQARDESPVKERIVIGLCHPKRECWVLAGFVPESKNERNALASLISTLSFDPCQKADRLNDRHDHEKRSAKRVLQELTAGDFERERRCWCETGLKILRSKGAATGLSEFIDEVRDRLCRLLPGR